MSDDEKTSEPKGRAPDPSPSPVDGEAESRRVEAYLRGDEASFREVDGWVRKEILARYPVLRHETEDLCQTIHQKLIENLRAGRYQGRSRLRSYVAGITHHSAIDRIRRVYRERAIFPEQDAARDVVAGENPYETLSRLQEKDLLRLAAQRAPAACKSLWRLIFLERLSYEQIGRRIGIPPGTVKSRMWYCRRQLMAALERLTRARRG